MNRTLHSKTSRKSRAFRLEPLRASCIGRAMILPSTCEAAVGTANHDRKPAQTGRRPPADARGPLRHFYVGYVEICGPCRASSYDRSHFTRNVERGRNRGLSERPQCGRAQAPGVLISALKAKGVHEMLIHQPECKWMLALVLILAEIPLFGQSQNLSMDELRTRIEQRYTVLPIQNGIVLSPKNRDGIASVEISGNTVAVNGAA